MTVEETIALLTGLVETREPFLHVRFGDGDVFFATGTGPTLTGDGEEWTVDLGGRLRAAWHTLAMHPGRLLVGDVESYAVSDGCEPQWRELVWEAERIRGRPLELVHMEALRAGFGAAAPFYAAVAADPRPKVYVAPAGLAPAARMLNADHVEVPLRVAHRHADEIFEGLINRAARWRRGGRRWEVALFSAGRGGKIMQAVLSAAEPDLTQIDVGSGLDVLFTDLRRGTDGQVDVERLRAEYRAAGLGIE